MDQRLRNKWWRLTHLYKIKNKQGQIVTFKPNYLQLKHIAERGAHRYNRLVKPRQIGFSTLYIIDDLDEAMWVPGMTCGIIAHEAKKLPSYFNIAKLAFDYFPSTLRPKTKTDTKYMYEFTKRFDGLPLDSSIYVATDIRGGTVQRLHITEIAYIKDYQKLKSGSKQAVPVGGSISEETTANGFNQFYDDFMESWDNKNIGAMDYKAYFYSWIENPEYALPGTLNGEYTKDEEEIKRIGLGTFGIKVTDNQLLWRRWKMNELKSDKMGAGLSTLQLFKQEYPLTVYEAFQSGSGNVFNAQKVDNIVLPDPIGFDEGVIKLTEAYGEGHEIIEKFKALHKLGVVFWEFPDPAKRYLIGVDPSDGTGGDNGVVDVWSDDELAQCAQYLGNVLPDSLAEIAAEMGRFYNEAFIGVENNLLTTIMFLSKIYSNYYFETKIDEKTQRRTKKIGFNTNTKTRDPMIDNFLILFEDDDLKVRSPITKREMKTFVKKENGKREHAEGKNDDALFAGFIAIEMRRHNKPRARGFAINPLQ